MKSRRVRLLEGMRRTLSDLLEERAGALARGRGWARTPDTTSSIFRLAAAGAPGLLDQLMHVDHLARQERGELSPGEPYRPPAGESERKQMLSAVRAAVRRSTVRGRG